MFIENRRSSVVFIMNKFFGKGNYEHLLEQTCENERISMGTMWITGNSQERKTAPISESKAIGDNYIRKTIFMFSLESASSERIADGTNAGFLPF